MPLISTFNGISISECDTVFRVKKHSCCLGCPIYCPKQNHASRVSFFSIFKVFSKEINLSLSNYLFVFISVTYHPSLMTLRQMDTKQLPNYWKHPSCIFDIRKTHSIWRNPGEWNCNSCRLQRSELIKSISLRSFYSQKGDWHPSGMAPVCCLSVLWWLWPSWGPWPFTADLKLHTNLTSHSYNQHNTKALWEEM